ncbi:hypothetical protein HanIR_Chr09g0396181 [Helianthus annuus]|nr:hypothetical protein HanIR_Chr09g0396181 [Helianthus annuus]
MFRVLGTHISREDLEANCIIIANHSNFWLDLILQFGIRAWYSNLGFNNLQIHPKKKSDFDLKSFETFRVF